MATLLHRQGSSRIFSKTRKCNINNDQNKVLLSLKKTLLSRTRLCTLFPSRRVGISWKIKGTLAEIASFVWKRDNIPPGNTGIDRMIRGRRGSTSHPIKRVDREFYANTSKVFYSECELGVPEEGSRYIAGDWPLLIVLLL